MSSEGEIVLSYENTSLRESDVALLSPPNWLNDNIIAFWFDYLENNIYSDSQSVVAFVCPQVVQYIKCGEQEDVKMMVESLQLQKKQYIFLPINDSMSQMTPGGSHWSILVYKASNKTFEHYDSFIGSANAMQAKNVARVLMPFLDSNFNESCDDVQFYEMDCCQQANGYDCGIHVICNTDALARIYLKNIRKPLTEIASADAISKARFKLKTLIESLKISKVQHRM